MYTTRAYDNQRPGYDRNYPNTRPSAGGGYGNRGGYDSSSLNQEIEQHALAFLQEVCVGLDRALNNNQGERLFEIVSGTLRRHVHDVVRNFGNFERVAGRDNPASIAGITLAGWMMYDVINASDRRVGDEIARYARHEWEIIENTSRDYLEITGQRSQPYSNLVPNRDTRPDQTSGGGYGSSGKRTSLVSPQPAADDNSQTRFVATTSMASLFMQAERERNQEEQASNPGVARETERGAEADASGTLVDPMYTRTSSVVDWMSNRDPVPPAREKAPTRPAVYAPVTPPVQQPPEAIRYGDDPVFNQMVDGMESAAHQRDIRSHAVTSQPMSGVDYVEDSELPMDTVAFEDNYEDLFHADSDGILENFDDVAFDPMDENVDALALLNFSARTLVDPTQCGGWKFYERDIDGQVDYDRSVSPYPKAYDATQFVKFRFINPEGRLVEFIKPKYPEGTDMDMQDHIKEKLIVRSEGSSINILELLTRTEARVPTEANRTATPAKEAEGIEAKVATADRAAFDTQVRNTTGETVAKAIMAKLASERKTKIEGFNERRLEPVFMGAEGMNELEKFRHIAAAAATYSGMVTKVLPALLRMPEGFQRVYRARLTAHFNDFLRNRMAMDFEIYDFFDDFEDARAELVDQLGEFTTNDKLNIEFKAFGRVAKIMPREAGRYSDVLGKDLATKDYVVFVTTMSTITLPFDSEEGLGALPDDDERFVGVSESENPQLHKLLSSVMTAAREVFSNPADVVRIVTTDDHVFYVDKGAFSVDGDCWIVSHEHRVAKLVS